MGADWRPDGGYLAQSHADATALLAVESEHAAVVVAKERFKHVAEETRISCQYDIGRTPGTLGPYTTYPANPEGCAAGSVWSEGQDGKLHNDGNNLLHRTNEWEASVWRKSNGTHTSWFEQVHQLQPGEFGPESLKQVPSSRPPVPLHCVVASPTRRRLRLCLTASPPHQATRTLRLRRSKRGRYFPTRWPRRRRARRATGARAVSVKLARSRPPLPFPLPLARSERRDAHFADGNGAWLAPPPLPSGERGRGEPGSAEHSCACGGRSDVQAVPGGRDGLLP